MSVRGAEMQVGGNGGWRCVEKQTTRPRTSFETCRLWCDVRDAWTPALAAADLDVGGSRRRKKQFRVEQGKHEDRRVKGPGGRREVERAGRSSWVTTQLARTRSHPHRIQGPERAEATVVNYCKNKRTNLSGRAGKRSLSRQKCEASDKAGRGFAPLKALKRNNLH